MEEIKISKENQELVTKLAASFEPMRKKAVRTFTILVWVGVGLAVTSIVCFCCMPLSKTASNVLPAIAIPCLIAALILFIVAGFKKKNFSRSFLATIRQSVNDALFPVREEKPNTMLNLKTIMAPGFFSQPDRYLGHSYMKSSYAGIPFEQAFYNLQKKEVHSDGKHTYVDWVTYASGTMYHLQFERDFEQIVKVLEKSGYFAFNSGGLEKVETEFILFNRKFTTLASDKTTVFYLLTPQIQEYIMSMENAVKGSFFLAFINNQLFIAVNDGGSSLNVSFLKPITDDVVKKIFNVYAIPMIFITLLGLNKTKFKKNAGV